MTRHRDHPQPPRPWPTLREPARPPESGSGTKPEHASQGNEEDKTNPRSPVRAEFQGEAVEGCSLVPGGFEGGTYEGRRPESPPSSEGSGEVEDLPGAGGVGGRPAPPRETKTTTTSVTADSTSIPRTQPPGQPRQRRRNKPKPNLAAAAAAAAAAALTITSCGPSTKKVVLTSLDTLAQQQSQLGTIAGSPALQDAARKLSAAVVDGGLDALSAEDRAALLETRTTALIEALTPVLANSIQQDLGPAVRQELNQAIRQAVREATTGPTQGRIERLAAGISQSIAEVLLPQVGPAVGSALRTDILPALEDSLKRTILAQQDNLVRTAVREGMNGLADALHGELGDVIEQRTEASTRILVAELDQRSSTWQNLAYALGAGIFGIAGLGWWGVHTRRKRIELVESTLLMVMETIKDNEADLAVRRTVRGIRSKGRDKETGAVLKQMLQKRPELRVEPAPEPTPAPATEPAAGPSTAETP